MARRGWPREIPILGGNDCYGDEPLWCWFVDVFGRCRPEVVQDAQRLLYSEVIRVSAGAGIATLGSTRKVKSRVWNRAMAKLGYTEGNPEA